MKESLRRHHTVTPLSDGTALIAGGWSGANTVGSSMTVLQTAEIYAVTPTNTTAYTTGKMLLSRTEHVAIRLQNNYVLLTGGYTTGSNGVDFASYSELYNPTTKAFSKVKNTLNAPEFYGTEHTMTILSTQKKVLLAGNGLVATLLYDEATDSFSKGPDMNISRVGPLAVPLSDGKILFVGGTCDQRAEIYDPIQNTFTLIQKTNGCYPVPIGAVLGDGKVFLTGYSSDTHLPKTYPTNGMTVNDINPKALTCPNGNGSNGSMEIFDASTGTFISTNISSGMNGKAFSLSDSMSTLFDPSGANNVRIYDPNKNQLLFSLATGTTRSDYTTALLSDGSILRSGGYLPSTSGTYSLISTNTVGCI